jgi:RNA 3'-terminal phosphate cyclase (ATP)
MNVRLTNIRSGRPRPGLGHQHLTAIRAVAEICKAKLAGDEIGSRELTFNPGDIECGEYRFDIGTAGSTVLVLQTLIPALLLADGDSTVTVTGGTHNPFAPCFEYLRDVFSVLASTANVQIYCEMKRSGFYPAGGGEVRLNIRGVRSTKNLSPLRFVNRGELEYIEGFSAVSKKLPVHITQRQSRQVTDRLAKAGHKAAIKQFMWDTDSPGTVVFLRAVFSRSVGGFFALGKRGKPAKQVADEAVLELLNFLESPGAIDYHAADQLLTIAALSGEESQFMTERITAHLLTNAAVVRQLTGRAVHIDGALGVPAQVILESLTSTKE